MIDVVGEEVGEVVMVKFVANGPTGGVAPGAPTTARPGGVNGREFDFVRVGLDDAYNG